MNEKVAVNDGKGLLDNIGLIDTLVEDCNELPKDLIDGHNIRFCSRLVAMVQKLANLKDGIKADMGALNDQIAELRKLNDELAEKAYGLPVDKGDDADVGD